jgi:hypothetical protein
MKAWSAALLMAGMLAVGTVRPAQAQGRSHIGVHAGYNFDVEKGLIGGQLLLPIGRRVEIYPSFDYYFVDPGSLFGISGDVKFRFPTGGESVFYAGGGVNWLRASGGASDTGWDLLFGLESRLGYTHPYVEGRVINHNSSAFQIAVGLNFTIF